MTLTITTDAFARFERLSFVPKRPARAGLGGEHRSRRPSPSTDFVDYRPYQPGDDFRRVDWNIYGRLGSLQVKVTEGRERLEVLLVLDCSSSMACGVPDKLEFAARLVAALGYIGLSRADSVRIACLTPEAEARSRFGPFARRARMPELVRDLSRVVPAGALELNRGLAQLIDTNPGSHNLVVVVSDLLTPRGVATSLDRLNALRADTVVLHVLSRDEADPRVSGDVELIDAETSERLELGVSLETLAAYRRRFAAWLEEREAECRARGMRYVRIRTDRDLSLVVLDDLRRAGVVR